MRKGVNGTLNLLNVFLIFLVFSGIKSFLQKFLHFTKVDLFFIVLVNFFLIYSFYLYNYFFQRFTPFYISNADFNSKKNK